MAEPKKPAPKPSKAAVAKHSPWVVAYQAQINADIQAVKAGALDEELLRVRLAAVAADLGGSSATLVLWLNALATGVIDNLSVLVEGSDEGPVLSFFPEWTRDTNEIGDILELPIPGPYRESLPGAGVPALGPSAGRQQAQA